MNWYKKANMGYRKPGDICWFEYHCNESPESCDADLWYRSHQKVKVVKLDAKGYGKTKIERGENGHPAVYIIQFDDGFSKGAFEDELVDSPKEFYRPDPPEKL